MLGGRLALAGAFIVTACLNAALAQMPVGRVYTLHSAPAGGCPALDWHIVVEPNDTLVGMIAWDNMQTIARASGTVNRKDHTFSMIATALGGSTRKATIQGRFDEQGSATAKIVGPHMTCDAVILPFNPTQPTAR